MKDAEGGGKKDQYGRVYKDEAAFTKAAKAYNEKKYGTTEPSKDSKKAGQTRKELAGAHTKTTTKKVKTVKKVILTSSVAAIYGNAEDAEFIPNKTFNEEMWNTSSRADDGEYSYSKTVAEKEAWHLNQNQDRWKLVVINPSFVIGPALNPLADFESKKFMLQMGNGDLKMGIPDVNLAMVDVRDTARAHILAAFNDNANGSINEPFRTLNQAASAMSNGDTCFIRGYWGLLGTIRDS